MKREKNERNTIAKDVLQTNPMRTILYNNKSQKLKREKLVTSAYFFPSDVYSFEIP